MKELDQMNNKLGLKGSRCAYRLCISSIIKSSLLVVFFLDYDNKFYRQLRSDRLQQIHIFSAILDLQKGGVEVRGINQKEAEAQVCS